MEQSSPKESIQTKNLSEGEWLMQIQILMEF